MPAPPYSSSTVMPSRPSAPSFGQSARGNSFVRSISAASGATSDAAKSATVSRSMSAVSPRSKSNGGRLLEIIGVGAGMGWGVSA